MRIVDPFRGGAAISHLLRSKSLPERPWQLRWKPVCASTELDLSDWLKEKPLKGEYPRALIAARQKHGVGQRGRIWESPLGGVWISAAIPLSSGRESAGLFGLAVAVAMVQRLQRYSVPVQIKWPNDLMVGDRKLAGFLPRLIHRGDKLRMARIGLGLNVCNRVPIGAISLEEILRPSNRQTLRWTVEALLALDRSVELVREPESICLEAQRFLWAQEVEDPQTGETMEIEGFDVDGSLKLRKGSTKMLWNRWV